jgi:dolichyl-phosphate-mannose-protein mannosyltransferase
MRDAPRAERAAATVTGLAMLLYLLQAWPALRQWSPTFDEPAHVGAGLSYLKTGDFKVNLQHPPLLKEIAAVPLVMTGVPFPMSAADWREVKTPADPILQWQLGGSVIYDTGDPIGVLFRARLPFLALTLGLIAAVYAWGRTLVGPGAAAVAACLVALDPTMVAHGVLVTTDTGFALAALLFLWALWRWLGRRGFMGLVIAGVALGAALAAKFTGLLLLPLALALLVAAVRWVPSLPGKVSNPGDPYASEEKPARVFWVVVATVLMVAVAALVIHAVYFMPADPLLYVKGAMLVNADHDPNYFPYMAGSFKPRFWTYYVMAWLLKEPLPAIVLFVCGVLALFRRDRAVSSLDRAFLLWPPVGLFLFYTFLSHNLGFRYLIPALPFMHLVAGAGAAWLWQSGALVRRAATIALGGWLAFNAWGIGADHLSFFNESACLWIDPARIALDAGSSCGPRWLDDSNVDWGQGLLQLKSWLDANAPDRPIGLAYFGTGRPQSYGIDANRINGQDVEGGLPIGLYAISAHTLARSLGMLTLKYGDGPGNWLAHTPPRAVVGHAFYIYEITPAR